MMRGGASSELFVSAREEPATYVAGTGGYAGLMNYGSSDGGTYASGNYPTNSVY